MDIKKYVVDSVLFNSEFKKIISDLKGDIPQDLKEYLKKIFLMYGKKEKEILEDLSEMMPTIYLKTIQDLELLTKKDEDQYLLNLEEQIFNS